MIITTGSANSHSQEIQQEDRKKKENTFSYFQDLL